MPVPVSLDDAKLHLRHASEELSVERQEEIEGFIADAAAWIEGYTGHILVAREVIEQFEGCARLQLTAWPIKPDATIAVAYAEYGGAPIAVSDARIDVRTRPARILPPVQFRWWTQARGTTTTVTVRAGYELDDTVPGNIRRAMLVLISAYDADREGGELFAKAVETASALCDRANLRLRRL